MTTSAKPSLLLIIPTVFSNHPLDDTSANDSSRANVTNNAFELMLETSHDDDETLDLDEEEIHKYWEAEITYIIVVVIFPVLLVFGTLGNMLTLIVLRRKTFTDKTAASWLFKYLAVMCTMCLWVGLPRHWLRAYFGIDIRQYHFLICQFHRYCLYSVMDITNWIFVSISADRLVAVTLPFKAHSISNQKNARRIFIGLCVFFAIFNSEVFFTYGRRYATVASLSNSTISNNNNNSSSGNSSSNETMIIVSECQERDIPAILFYNRVLHPFISFTLFVIGPFCFMLASSITVARKMAERRAFMKRASVLKSATMIATNISVQQATTAGKTNNIISRNPSFAPSLNDREATMDGVQRSTTTLMFVASVEFLITATPAFFLDITEKPLKQSTIFNTRRGMARFQLLYTVVRLLLFSNFAFHFFLFCLSTPRFRREVVRILSFCLGGRRRRQSRRQSTPGSSIVINNNQLLTVPSTSLSSSNIEMQGSSLLKRMSTSSAAAFHHSFLAKLKLKRKSTLSSPSSLSPNQSSRVVVVRETMKNGSVVIRRLPQSSFSSGIAVDEESEADFGAFADYQYIDDSNSSGTEAAGRKSTST